MRLKNDFINSILSRPIFSAAEVWKVPSTLVSRARKNEGNDSIRPLNDPSVSPRTTARTGPIAPMYYKASESWPIWASRVSG